jgi:hypothetical protein
VRSIRRRELGDELVSRLHALSNRLMAEDLDHFRIHAHTNQVVHVYERADGALQGFQFWRTVPMELPGCRAILGGKLRVLPEARGGALHLRSGLRFYLENQLRHPLTRYYRLSLASLFGFVSITSALADYRMFDPGAPGAEARAVRAAFERLAAESHYTLDPDTGLFDVDIVPSAETLAAYPPRYFARPEAQAYVRANPGFRDNGCYAAFWFRFTPANLASLARAIARKRGRLTAPTRRSGDRPGPAPPPRPDGSP